MHCASMDVVNNIGATIWTYIAVLQFMGPYILVIWRQYVLPKCWYPTTILLCTTIWIFSAVKTSNLRFELLYEKRNGRAPCFRSIVPSVRIVSMHWVVGNVSFWLGLWMMPCLHRNVLGFTNLYISHPSLWNMNNNSEYINRAYDVCVLFWKL